jgi:hypothetical protein
MDINMYINLWLNLSKFSLKADEKAIESIRSMVSFLVHNYDKRIYLTARNMTIDEVCSLLVAFSVLDMYHTIIHKDCVAMIEKHMDSLDNQQLIQLISVSRYVSKFKPYSGNFKINIRFLSNDS